MNQTLPTLLKECDNLKSRLSELRPLPFEALKKIEEALQHLNLTQNRIEVFNNDTNGKD